MDKQRVAVIRPFPKNQDQSQVLNDNGHEVRIWGNIAEQINEINDEHTNKRYFKDIVLDEKIKAYHDLEEALKDADAVLFVVPTKVTRLVAKRSSSSGPQGENHARLQGTGAQYTRTDFNYPRRRNPCRATQRDCRRLRSQPC